MQPSNKISLYRSLFHGREDIEALILAFPFAFEGKLTQYVGLLLHGSSPKVLIVYHDKQLSF